MTPPKILVIEDDHDLRVGLNARLRVNGFRTRLADDGARAVEMAESDPPDAILLDIGLPTADGFEVISWLRRRDATADIPVIVLSARDPEHAEPRALEAGAFAFLRKPVSSEELITSLEQALAG